MTRLRTIATWVTILSLFTCSVALAAGPCGTRAHRPRKWNHVIWIWLENHSYDQIIGSVNAPYINSIATQCGSATNFHNLTHVSLGNYIGAVTGLDNAALMPFDLDCSPGVSCQTGAKSIFEQVPSWKAYMESMTTNCQATGLVGYAVRHNPPPYLSNIAAACSVFDVPYTELQTDLDNNTLPAFSFITPNTVNDGHDGGDPVSIVNTDTWLSTELPKILNSSAYLSGTTVVFITWDEGEGPIVPGYFGKDCSTNTTDADCHVATIVVSPSTRPGTVSTTLFNHYSLLRTTERMLGVRRRSLLGLAKQANTMRGPFRL